jgi:hypothetical protein
MSGVEKYCRERNEEIKIKYAVMKQWYNSQIFFKQMQNVLWSNNVLRTVSLVE